MTEKELLGERIARVREALAQAAARAGKTEDQIRLIAVSKKKEAEMIGWAGEFGLREMGENYTNEVCQKFPAVSDEISIHFIGQLQKNKVKYIIDKVCMIQSVDRMSLAEEIERQAVRAGRVMPVLIQVNAGREPQKGGVFPEEMLELARQVSALEHLKLEGMMAVAPLTETPEQARPYYRDMKTLFDAAQAELGPQFSILSMGMTRDFPVAIEEGANMVRVGEAIFGRR